MLVSLTDAKQYETVKTDLINTIGSNINAMFQKSVAVKIDESDGNGLKLTFSIPYEDLISTATIYVPSSIINGKQFLNKK